MIKGLLFLVLIAAALGGLTSACSGPTALPFFADSAGPAPTTSGVASAAPAAATTTTSSTTTTAAPTTTTTTAQTTTTTAPTTTSSPHPPGVLVIGDSVLEGLRVLQYSFGPNTIYDTAVSRSVLQLPDVVAEHEIPQNLVVHLGTNGWWPELGQGFSATFGDLSDRRIVLVNISVDRAYTDLANTELRAVADEHQHVTLVDWNQVATPEMLRTDGYHPNLEGYDVIANMIAAALELPPEFELVPPTTVQPDPAESGQLVLE